jgi:hypothetical protein
MQRSHARHSRTAGLALGSVVATCTLAVVAAAVGGPLRLSGRAGLWEPMSPSSVTLPPRADQPPGAPPPSMNAAEPPQWLAWALWIVAALAVAFTLVWIWRRIAARLRARRVAEPVESEPVGEVYPDAPVIRAGLTSALDELSVTANPTDAVLRAWIALEVAASRSGVPRDPADTPTEFTGHVLAATGADRDAVDALLHLYHQARFSWHGLSSADRESARSCLEGLAASWSSFDHPAPDRAGDRPGHR